MTTRGADDTDGNMPDVNKPNVNKPNVNKLYIAKTAVTVTLAYAMPPVRMSQRNARSLLARHFLPNTLKFELLLSLIQRQPPVEAIADRMNNMVFRWLDEGFDAIEINSVRYIQ